MSLSSIARTLELGKAAPRAHFAVKNTFIEFDDSFDDEDFEASCQAMGHQRQMSEPVFSLARRLQQADEEERKNRDQEDMNSSTTGSSAGDTEGESPQQQATSGEAESEPQQPKKERQSFTLNPSATPFDEPQGYACAAAGGMGAETPVDPQQQQWAMMWAAPAQAQDMMMVMAMPQEARESWANASEGLEPTVMAGHFGGYEMEPAAAASYDMEPVAEVSGPPRPEEWADVTTLMMRNLPNRYTQQMLLEEVCNAGFSGGFDFLYLPIDPETNANKGYAFINMTDSEAAWRFKLAFEDKKMARFNSSKFVSVSPAALQGLEANYAHYSTTRCSRGDPATRPLFLREPAPGGRGATRARGSRRGGQRHREKGRSLVDVAAQKLQEEQSRKQRPQALAPAAAATAAPAAQEFSAQFCPYCGGRVQPSFRFCQFCGAAQNGSS